MEVICKAMVQCGFRKGKYCGRGVVILAENGQCQDIARAVAGFPHIILEEKKEPVSQKQSNPPSKNEEVEQGVRNDECSNGNN